MKSTVLRVSAQIRCNSRFIRSRVLNLTFNNATLAGGIRFRSTLRARGLYKLYVVNILAIIATLGLATPWAVVRTLRYRADNTFVIAENGFEGFMATDASDVAATGPYRCIGSAPR